MRSFIIIAALCLGGPAAAQEVGAGDPFYDHADNCLSHQIAGSDAMSNCLVRMSQSCEEYPLPDGVTDCLDYETRVWKTMLKADIANSRKMLSNIEIEGRDVAAEFDAEQAAWEAWMTQHCALNGTVTAIFYDSDLSDYCVLRVTRDRTRAVRALTW